MAATVNVSVNVADFNTLWPNSFGNMLNHTSLANNVLPIDSEKEIFVWVALRLKVRYDEIVERFGDVAYHILKVLERQGVIEMELKDKVTYVRYHSVPCVHEDERIIVPTYDYSQYGYGATTTGTSTHYYTTTTTNTFTTTGIYF